MRVFCLVVGFVVVGLVSTAAQAEEPDTGRLLGTVTSDAEAPLETLLVSASGPTGTTVATCDAAGRFEFSDLHPGLYLVRAHASGFTTAGRHIVEINSGLSTLHSMRLRQVASVGAGPSPVLAAGAAPGLTGVSGADWFHENAEAEQPDPLDAEPREPADRLSAAPHAHTEKAWRLRRARRSVLKDVSGPLWAAGGGERPRVAERGVLSARPSNDLLGGLALSGQFQLLARTQIDAPAGLWSANQLPGQVAYVDVGAPSGESGWGLRGAVTMGDSGSWVLAGSYLAELTADHVIALDASYSKQRPLQEELDLTAAERSASDTDANREVGSVKADGRWALSRRLSVGYGAALARYGYLEQGRLFSPHAEVVVEPVARTRVRAAVARNMSAPGAEEFLPSAAGFWLPPERTFAPLSPLEPLQAQRTRHIELALERDLGSASVISVRRFQQRVANQTVTLFGVEPGAGRSVTDHYYLANARGLDAAGWGVSFSHELAGRVRGAVEYSVTRSQWDPWRGAWLLPEAASAWRTGTERFHDVTTSIETEIPETATSVFVLARVNTAFARAAAMPVTPGLGTRFAFRVKQTLPFAPFGDSDWEVLVDVRNLLHEQTVGASVYDELLVVNPPKQFVGGLVVHF